MSKIFPQIGKKLLDSNLFPLEDAGVHTKAVLCLFVLLIGLNPMPAQNLILNGDFEQPQVQGMYQTYQTGQFLGPWQVSKGTIDHVSRDYTFRPPGTRTQTLDLNGSSPGAIAQRITTTPGALYRLTWKISAGSSVDAQVLWNAHIVRLWNLPNSAWTPLSVLVSGHGFDTLEFESLGGGTASYYLDDITLIPEPDPVAIPNQRFVITNTASSSSPPVSFHVGAPVPSGATINSNGVFTWTPSCVDGGTVVPIVIWATDSGNPPRSTSFAFTIQVRHCAQLSFDSSIVNAGERSEIPLSLFTSAPLSNLSFEILYPEASLLNWAIMPSDASIDSATLTKTGAGRLQAHISARAGQVIQGSSLLAAISAETASARSSLAYLHSANITLLTSDNSAVPVRIGAHARIVALHSEPILEMNSELLLTLYGNPGVYNIFNSTTVESSDQWINVGSVTVTDFLQTIDIGPATNSARFLKARRD